MALYETYDCDASKTRMQAGEFTNFTRFVHPCIDAVVPTEDLHLVPRQLMPRGGLKWKVAPGHPKMQDDLEDRTGTGDLITSFRADLDHMHGKVSQLESFIRDFLGSSNGVSSTPVSERHLDDKVASAAQPSSPGSQSVSLCSITEQDCCSTAGEADQKDSDGSSVSERFTVHPLRKRRSFGPYELFWMQNNPYGATEDVGDTSGDAIEEDNNEDQVVSMSTM